jgi:GT2 family glycosyltransferase
MEQGLPFFSVVIPTYARSAQLAVCLDSLAGLDYPHTRFEVIVVDDGSPVPPEATVAALRDRLELTLLVQPHAGPAAARNAGAARATGEFLGFIDDDCAAAPGWLSALALASVRQPDQAMGGRTVNALPGNRYATASQLLISYLYDYYSSGGGGVRFVASNNLAVPADRFRRLGGFDATYPQAGGEDRDFCDRWLSQGYQIAYVPEALVKHAHALSLRRFWHQHVTYGRGAFHYHQGRAHRGQGRVAVEPPSFYLNLLRYPYSQVRGRQAWSLASLLFMSQVANAAGYVCERVHHGVDHAALGPQPHVPASSGVDANQERMRSKVHR